MVSTVCRIAALVAMIWAFASDARADIFVVKTMRTPFPTKQVDRGLKLPKGWLDLSLAYDHKLASGYWDSAGQAVDFSHAKFTYQTEHAVLRYGWTNKWEFTIDLPYHEASLTSDLWPTGTPPTSSWGVGDPHIGAVYEIYGEGHPGTSVVAEAYYKGALGNSSPGSSLPGPTSFETFVFTTGTPDLALGVGAKQKLGPIAFTAHARYVHRFSAVVGYLVDSEYNQFAGRIKPGDLVQGDLALELQLGPVWVDAGGYYTLRGITKTGTTAPGPNLNKYLTPVAGSDGSQFDLDVRVGANVSRGVDVSAHGMVPLVGQDLQFFPIEDLQPTRGLTFGGSLDVRY